ncbi:hypothetical protein, partial [Mangrovibacterium sp.]|uniref:hypothetical protein n=1 Tax=Mangrovibacterium sp. TaxID=1961364 RepID=UPI0035668BF8
GYEKQRAQAKAAYEQELADIEKQGRDYLAKLNESKGFSVSDDGYITELPAEVQASLNAQKENAARQYANEIVAINADAATTIKEIWADATQESMSDLDKELASIDDYYNKLKKQAEEAGRTDLVPSIDDERLKARAQAIADSNVKIIENEQELEEKRNEIAATGATNETKWQVKSLETKIKYAEKKLEVVRKLHTKEAQYQAQALELEIELYQQMINKIEFESKLANLEESLDVLTQMVNKYSEYLDLSEEQVDVLNNGATALSGVMDIAKGDYLSGGVKVVTAMVDTLISAQDNLTEEIKESVSAMMDLADGAETAADAISNITFDSSGSIAYLKFLQESIISLTDDAKALNEEITYDRYGRRGEESSNVLRSVYSGYREELAELNAEIEELSTQILTGGLSPEHMEAAEAILNAYSELQDRMSSIEEDLIGTSVNDLADSLAEAFLAGEDAAEAWGEKVDDIIQKVIIDQLTAQLLTEPIQKAVDQLIVDLNDGDTTGRTQTDPGLTVDEAQNFKDSVLDILESAGPAFDAVREAYEAAGFSFSSDDSESGYDELTGITQSLTEETGSLLVGQFMAMRIDLKGIGENTDQCADYLMQSLAVQQEIAQNTSYNKRLVTIEEKIAETNKLLSDKL